MSEIHLITVGKLKDKQLEEIENRYLKRITSPKLKISEVKSYEENLEKEGAAVLKKIDQISGGENYQLILLTENGEEFNSTSFSSWLCKLHEVSKKIIFIIGGASGHGNDILKTNHITLSLSKMTFPHKLARILLIEQLYRAQAISKKHPYHK